MTFVSALLPLQTNCNSITSTDPLYEIQERPAMLRGRVLTQIFRRSISDLLLGTNMDQLRS